ncbi:PH domain-containing protein [Isoptericola haloaureus]|uniref:PH domain-containing protein n=1 Tax=Isoptericola haloaureus TaxID=1542902 RepID=A0ABU7ZBT0_9MICO
MNGADPDLAVRRHSHLRRYVLAGERVSVATRLHWAKLVEPIATTLAATVLVAWLHSTSGSGLVWVLWLLPAGRLVARWAEWHYEWFVATDKRLLLTYGFIIHKVAMMPLAKVTDMGYTRTPVGQVLGYGRFVMESAGQDQALRQIDHVPDPDQTYRTLCDTIFAPKPPPGNGGSPSPPPAIAPSGRAAPRPTTAEIPVVPVGTPDPAPAPPAAATGRARPLDGGADPRPTTADTRHPGRRGWIPARRRPVHDTPPDAGDGGPIVPDPFL